MALCRARSRYSPDARCLTRSSTRNCTRRSNSRGARSRDSGPAAPGRGGIDRAAANYSCSRQSESGAHPVILSRTICLSSARGGRSHSTFEVSHSGRLPVASTGGGVIKPSSDFGQASKLVRPGVCLSTQPWTILSVLDHRPGIAVKNHSVGDSV